MVRRAAVDVHGHMTQLPPLLPKPAEELHNHPLASPLSAPSRTISKRKSTSVACDACRKRKTKCDGKRPRCSICVNRSVVSCNYRTKARHSQISEELIQKLQTLPRNEAVWLLGTIRRTPSPCPPEETTRDAEVDVTNLGPSLSEQQVLRGLLPPTKNSLEFELNIRYPIAYPTLYPVQLDVLSLETILKPRRPGRLSSPCTSSDSHNSWLEFKEAEGSTIPSETRELYVLESSSTTQQRPLVDERLNHVDIRFWTDVPIDDALAAHIISLYLELDYPVMPVFNADLFLDDLVSHRSGFCCSFLVSSLLCFGCQLYTGIAPKAATFTVAFYTEARRRWTEYSQHDTTIMAVAGINLLSMAVICYGRDDLAKRYLADGMKIAKQLGLYGPQKEKASPSSCLNGKTDKWIKAASYTAWGVFNWACIYGLHYQTAWIEAPPTLPRPRNIDGNDGALLDVQVFQARCELSIIINEILWKYYTNHGTYSASQRASQEFAENMYCRLLAWAASLPLDLARTDHSSHATFLMHVYYHAIITDLFRPFLASTRVCIRLPSFVNTNTTTQAIFCASLDQLKRLILIYRLKFKLATHSVLWQTGIVYVVNGLIREAHTAKSTEWRFYFKLCMAALEDLTASFRVFETIARALLGMALQKDVIDYNEAKGVVKELHTASRHHIPIENETADRARWIIDLDLGVTDPYAAQGSTLAEDFEGLLLIDEFTTGEWGAGHGGSESGKELG